MMPSIAPKPSISGRSSHPPLWFWFGILGVFLLSLGLRFWGLSRFNTLVFDEVYYAKFAGAFLKGEIVFTGHPPLSTYIIAIGIWIGHLLPWGNEGPQNALAGLMLSPWSYRWLNALTGSFIPLIMGAIAYQLSRRYSYALLAALFTAADGLLLVESRYALNNVYLLSFGLLGHLFFLRALKAQFLARWLWLGLAGIGFGASAAIKWNGLGFLLGTYLTWAVGWGLHWIDSWRSVQAKEDAEVGSRKVVQSPLQNLSQLHLGHVVVCLALIPALTYYLSWTPYMWVDSSSPPWDVQRFVDLNLETLNYHARVGGPEVHPYCSRWFTWPLMLRPIAYFYQTTHGINEPPAIVGPPLPQEQGFERAIYDVHAMGNPILWWLSTAAMVLAIVLLGYQLWRWLTASRVVAGATTSTVSPTFGTRGWLLLFVVLNWTANFLPWVRITRCIFLYHYMASFLFAVLALALWVDRWLQSQYYWYRVTAIASVMLVLIAFIFWMPLFLGLPVSPTELQLLRWLPSWV